VFTLSNGDTVKEETARKDLDKAADTIRSARQVERESSLTIGRTLASVKASGLVGILLTDDERETVSSKRLGSAFVTWTEGLGINKSARSRYLSHAATVDGLIKDGLKAESAETVSASLARSLVKAAKAETAENGSESHPADIVRTMDDEGLSITAESVAARFASESGHNRQGPKVQSVGSLVTAILQAADSSLPTDFGTVSLDDIDRAYAIMGEWAANSHALIESAA